jgi:hypothetical protein
LTVVGSTKAAMRVPLLFTDVLLKVTLTLTPARLFSSILKEIIETLYAKNNKILLSLINLMPNTY